MKIKVIITDLDGVVLDTAELEAKMGYRYVNVNPSWQEDPEAEATLDIGDHN